jgi:glucokinase
MDYNKDKRVVLTLDAGGTNFVFSAIQGNEEIIEKVRLDSNGDNLEKSLKSIIEGFETIISGLKEKPVAISFAFPGPADYHLGIIGELGNLPAYRGGVALKQMLEDRFKIPVFINNDGNLFVLGEAIAGFLPYINRLLENAGSPKRYKTLFGVTLGTGFGGGFVSNEKLLIGDNSNAAEVWLLRNKLEKDMNVEESISIRGIKRFYSEQSGISFKKTPEPIDIFEIAIGKREGDKKAAEKAFKKFGEIIGDALSNAVTLFDSPIVIGGGLSGASSIFLPEIMKEMNSVFDIYDGKKLDRLEAKVFNIEDDNDRKNFVKGELKKIKVPFSNKTVEYDPLKRICVGLSKLGTSKAVSIGAYAFALDMLG